MGPADESFPAIRLNSACQMFAAKKYVIHEYYNIILK